jgi:glucokinase
MKYCIGVDLGGTYIKFGAVGDDRRPLPTFQLPTPEGRDALVERMAEGARQLMSRHGLAAEDVVGVGVGSPGPLKISEGIVISSPNLKGIENLPLRDMLSQTLKLPAVLENDANAAAYGEWLCGAGRNIGDMVLLTLGTGVGGGIVIDGKVLHGAHEIGAELGHMLVHPGGEQCNCGQMGCLERYCSAEFIAQYAMRLIRQGRPSVLARKLEVDGNITAKDINEARNAGDELAGEVWARGIYYLAIGCVSIARIFDPDAIVLAGGMTAAGDDLMVPLREQYHRLHWKLTEPLTGLAMAQLGGEAGAIGAAGVAWAAFGDKN